MQYRQECLPQTENQGNLVILGEKHFLAWEGKNKKKQKWERAGA